LSEGAIRQQASAESFQRGQDYYRGGAVLSLVRRGDVLQARVAGSQYEPYRVRVDVDAGGMTWVTCNCPYDWGGWCKHIVAVLLACLDDPDQIEDRPTLDQLLADLDRQQLRDLVLALADDNAALAEAIEGQIDALPSTPGGGEDGERAAPSPRRTTIDPQPIRRQVDRILHSLDRMRPSEAYWHVSSVVNEVGEVLDQAWAFIEAGEGENALIYLEAITDEYVNGWVMLDDSDGEASGFFATLGQAWTEAALVVDLSPAEREAWCDTLNEWQAEIAEYGMDDVFDAAQAALVQGWEYPPLQRILSGQIAEPAPEREDLWYADDLNAARLCVLDRQGRHQEYLYLARATGRMHEYVLMLARLGRVQEAVDAGVQYQGPPQHVLSLAMALREQGALEEAVRVAEHGLTLDGYKAPLATWLLELALGLGRDELALRAALVAFRAAPDLDLYRRIEGLSGERWPALREELLAQLNASFGMHTSGAVEVLLHEERWDDAIAAAEKGGGYSHLERVMDAVIEHRPEWVIRAACQQAARIIEPGKARYYHHAVEWLGRARDAYRAAGREAEWRSYLREIRDRHGRKYKLMGMLEGW
jgi:uncharacterized Zn finger protein